MLTEHDRQRLRDVCSVHPVAWCIDCQRWFGLRDLTSDLITGRRFQFCPGCRADLAAALRQHLETCKDLRAGDS
jgi:hypothetical protein